MILYLIRHGETAHNRDGLGLGRDDVPLTGFGRLQAQAIAARLGDEPIDHVFSSPLRRAFEVASLIAEAKETEPQQREALIELDVGETEGLPFAEIRSRFPTFLAEWSGPAADTAVMPGGESLRDVDVRLAGFLDELTTLDSEAVAVVSHNFVIRLVVCRLLGLPPSRFRSFVADVASVSALRLHQGAETVMFLNDTCHLRGLEPTVERG